MVRRYGTVAQVGSLMSNAQAPMFNDRELIREVFWCGKRVLVTGHTGFKGSWLCHWLAMMGSRVQGFALAPLLPDSMFDATGVADFVDDTRGDVRDLDSLRRCLAAGKPEIVFHLAAQPLVRASYAAPVDTFGVNVMGTAHVLEAIRATASVRAVVVVTTDKCYDNLETDRRYRETDALGGHDPYSASKACAELVTAAYRKSYFASRSLGIATARAGNVIGGGDWAEERLIPDCLRAFAAGIPVVLRSPEAVRPWQHVLEPLSGYLGLAQALWTQPEACSSAYNFGPAPGQHARVQDVVQLAARAWGEGARFLCRPDGKALHEACLLQLDSSLAQQDLGWTPRWTLEQALELTMAWYRAYRAARPSGREMLELTRDQVVRYSAETSIVTKQLAGVPADSIASLTRLMAQSESAAHACETTRTGN